MASIPFTLAVVLRVTLVLGAFAGASLLLRRQPAALRHALWSIALAGSIAVPAIAALGSWRVPVLPAPSVRTDSALTPRVAEPATVLSDHPAASVPGPTVTSGPPAAGPASAATDSPGTTARTAPATNGMRMLLAAWALGALVLLVRFIMGIAGIRGIVTRAAPVTDADWQARLATAARRVGLRRAAALRSSDAVDMPFASGLLRPVVVVPASASEWAPARRDAVLMHELAHLTRGDFLMNVLSLIARALYWFHPLAWLASHRLRVEGERACDDVVLRGGAVPSEYAGHLLDIVQSFGRATPAPALAMARRSDFEGRLLSILEPRERRALSRLRLTAVGAGSIALLLALSAISPTARVAALPPVAQGTADSASSAPARPPARVASRAQVAQEVPVAGSTVAALVETLGDANASVRVAAVKSLGSLKDPRAIAALAKALREDADPRVREAAAWALGEIDDARAVPALLEALKTERVAAVREQVVHALGEIDDPAAVSGVSAVVKDPSAAVRREAVWALGELDDPTAVPALVTMVKDEDVEVRRRLADALDNLKNAAAFDALVTLARDADAEVRASAINALGNLEDVRVLSTLIAALQDANAEVRHHAADAIHNVPDLRKAPRELIAALSDADADVRHGAAEALGSIGDDAAVPALKKATSDANAEVRRASAEALSEIGGPEAITALMGLLKDSDPEIRKIAAEALGKRR